MDEDERPWIGRRVWIVDIKGRRHHGTLWWNNGATVHVRIDTPEVVLVPVMRPKVRPPGAATHTRFPT
jgi:hypothetical protein